MNLVIDVGNTLVKLAVFDSGILKHKKTCVKTDFLATLGEFFENFPSIDNSIVSSVAHFSEQQISKLEKLCNVLLLDHTTTVPFINKYGTPKTLGIDRIALASAAVHLYINKNVLVIDAGTCITYDFINSENEYLGGAISPGISLRYKSLHTFTDKLPLLEANNSKLLIGNSTATSIHAGVVNGVLYEIDGFIEAYKNNYENLTVILTGGDAHFLRDTIKNDIFANSNFLLEGLNHILEYNKH
ncbi:MAG TPA: type III pantothenate kinase [Aequorivita sp.]|jgi:type III pantothenate kinase|nr:pantothenate kinase [Aequorivita sp.]HBC03654.1 type III pantothenate kinase [Aequorivita sp.]HNP68961.1 type III pantothenate kinase [Aequorivita sp.]|tara:strand:- start:15707 stop:16435 length:729 start_codon:yes stop_codon:yes gene_type:complete